MCIRDRLEGGGREAAGDFVAQLVERVTHGELGGDAGDREARGLGGECGGAGLSLIHICMRCAQATASSRPLWVPPSEKESGVTFRMPMMSGWRRSISKTLAPQRQTLARS